MKIAVIGTGYVGLVVGACFAETGNDVTCVDTDPAKIRQLNRGKVPFYEPGLEELVRRNRAEKRLAFTTKLPDPVRRAEVVIIAVGTPTGEDGSADLQHVLAAARDVARAMNGYKVIVDKSTVPAGTSERVREVIRKETTHPFSVVSNPEFLKQGAAVDDFLKPDRVVIGASDTRGAEIMTELYRPFTRTGAPIMVMDCASAELCKYAANAMLATRISFMNEIAHVCERYGADVDRVRQAMASDRRIGSSFLFPGVGYGGSCFPKDVKAIVRFSADKKYRFRILEAVEAVNYAQKLTLLDKLDRHFGKSLERQDDRGLGPGVQAADGRHARGARDSDHQGPARARRPRSGVRPEGAGGGAARLQVEGALRPPRLRSASRRRCAARRDRVERVPGARFHPHEADHEAAGGVRRPQHLHPRTDPRRSASPITPSAGR